MTPSPLTLFISHPSPYMTDNKPHGDGLIAFSFLRQLAALGHTVHVATPLFDIKASLPPNLVIHHIPTRAAASDDKQSLAFRVEYAIRVRRLFSRLQKTIRFDVIHQMNPVVLGLNTLLRGTGVPVLMGPFWSPWPSENNTGFKARLRTRVRNLLLSATVRQCDGALAPNLLTADLLRQAGMDPQNIFMVPLGIDTEMFFPDPTQTPSHPTILFLAGLWKRKGIHTLLAAFDIVASRMPTAELLIAGSGEEQPLVEETIRTMPHGSRVRLLGPVQRGGVRQTMQRCTVYCLPSFGEPFGMSAMEAMACGKPLVVTNNGGLGQLVPQNGGIKVPPGDVPLLADALQRILEDTALATQMGEVNRTFVVQQHSWTVASSALAKTYYLLQARFSLRKLPVADLASSAELPQ